MPGRESAGETFHRRSVGGFRPCLAKAKGGKRPAEEGRVDEGLQGAPVGWGQGQNAFLPLGQEGGDHAGEGAVLLKGDGCPTEGTANFFEPSAVNMVSDVLFADADEGILSRPVVMVGSEGSGGSGWALSLFPG